MFTELCVIPHLVNEAKPTSDVGSTGGRWEILYGIVEFWEWFYSLICDAISRTKLVIAPKDGTDQDQSKSFMDTTVTLLRSIALVI